MEAVTICRYKTATVNTLKCSACNAVKPDEKFYPRAANAGRRGRDSVCAACCLSAAREYRKKNIAKVKAKQREWYYANQGTLLKSLGDKRDRNREAYNASMRQWRARNLEHARKYDRDLYVKNRHKKLAHKRGHYAAHREKFRERWRAWWASHREEWNAAVRARQNRKRAAAAPSDRREYKAFLKFIRIVARIPCYWCGRNIPMGQRAADHIVPLAKGGKDVIHNLCCACRSCNSRKHAKLPEEFSGQFQLPFC